MLPRCQVDEGNSGLSYSIPSARGRLHNVNGTGSRTTLLGLSTLIDASGISTQFMCDALELGLSKNIKCELDLKLLR